MTDLLDRPTEERTDLISERWEVETSTPMAITGEVPAGDADFVLMSHAEQAVGDFPTQVDDRRELFFQLRSFANSELGLNSVVGGILFVRDAVPAFSFGDTRFVWGEQGFQSLRGLLAAFVEQSSGINRIAQRAIVEETIEQFPVPIFGSPPSAWQTLGQIIEQGPSAVFTGYALWTEQPVLALVGGGVSLLIWFAKPHARLFRRSTAQRLADRLGVPLRPEDEA